MHAPAVLLVGLTAVLALSAAEQLNFVPTGDCEDVTFENRYKYKAKQSHFDKENEETVEISCDVMVTCDAAGTYGDEDARVYNMVISNTAAAGNIFDKDDNTDSANVESTEKTVKTFDDLVFGWFKFLQTADGSVPVIYHAREESSDALNLKKSITAGFQANFKGTSSKVEADPQSRHRAAYTYKASAQDEKEGIVRMHRRVTSEDVEDYSSHIPGDVVALDKEEDIEYKKGVLTHSEGVMTTKMMPQDETSEEEDVEGDSLEAEEGGEQSRDKREQDMSDYFELLSESVSNAEEDDDSLSPDYLEPDDSDYDGDSDVGNGGGSDDDVVSAMEEQEQTYDPNVDMNHMEAKGSYSLDLVGQRRVLQRERRAAVNHLELPEAVESSLLAHIDLTREDMDHMKKLHTELGDIRHSLNTIHNDPATTTALVNNIKELLALEAKYGPISGQTPTIDDVLNYLKQLLGSTDEQDSAMRALLYFMLSSEGSRQSQMALLAALDSAVDEEEQRSVVVYIAFTENPQPQMISELEHRIGDNTQSTDSLLLAYGALVAKASPDLQRRMTLFLLSRLPHAETNSSALIHHILSLGNTESHEVVTSLTSYLHHPDPHVQLSSIHALRYATDDGLVQKALITLLSQSPVSDEQLATVLQSLLYGVEHASNNHLKKPFNADLATALLASIMETENDKLIIAFFSYLRSINSLESRQLLKMMSLPLTTKQMEGSSNGTRLRRGSDWDQNNPIYNLVSPLATRQNDVKLYTKHKGYIWGRKVGVKHGNVQFAAGGFIGVSKAGDYKVFGHSKAVGHAFGKTKTAVDFLVLREKSSTSTRTQLYAEIIGKTLLNINDVSKSTVCKRFSKPLYNSKKYTLLNFQYTFYLYVTNLKVNVAVYVSLNSNLYVEFCEKKGSLTAEAGLVATITLEITAGATANLLAVVRGGISVSGIFNYRLNPKLSTEVCYTNFQIRVKNCVGIYHQWTNNRIVLDTWHQRRSIKWCKRRFFRRFLRFPCGFIWGPRKVWNALSTSWNLGSSPNKPLWERCDKSFICKAIGAPTPPRVTLRPIGVRPPFRKLGGLVRFPVAEVQGPTVELPG